MIEEAPGPLAAVDATTPHFQKAFASLEARYRHARRLYDLLPSVAARGTPTRSAAGGIAAIHLPKLKSIPPRRVDDDFPIELADCVYRSKTRRPGHLLIVTIALEGYVRGVRWGPHTPGRARSVERGARDTVDLLREEIALSADVGLDEIAPAFKAGRKSEESAKAKRAIAEAVRFLRRERDDAGSDFPSDMQFAQALGIKPESLYRSLNC